MAAGSLGLACGLLVAPASVSAAPPTGPIPSVYRPLSSNAPAPSITGLDRSIGRLTRSASLGSFSMLVVDPVSEKPVFSDQVNKARTPASVSKLLTAAAALSALGPDTRLATRATLAGSDLYLVGGGDPRLRKAKGENSLKALALDTISALKTRKVTNIRLFFDDSLFTGPALGPGWKSSFPKAGIAGPVSALSVGGGAGEPWVGGPSIESSKASWPTFCQAAEKSWNRGLTSKARSGPESFQPTCFGFFRAGAHNRRRDVA